MRLVPDLALSEAAEHSTVTAVRAGRAVVLSSGRNAWHSTWVNQYRLASSFFSDVYEAQRAAEPLRKQGTTFRVREVPVLVVSGMGCSVVLMDWQRPNSFAGWTPFDREQLARHARAFPGHLHVEPLPPLSADMSISEFVNCFEHDYYWREHPGYDSAFVATAPTAAAIAPQNPGTPLRAWRSVANGTLRNLSWHASTVHRYSWGGTHTFLSDYRHIVTKAG